MNKLSEIIKENGFSNRFQQYSEKVLRTCEQKNYNITDEVIEAVVMVSCIFLESRYNFYVPRNRKAVNSYVYDILNDLNFNCIF